MIFGDTSGRSGERDCGRSRAEQRAARRAAVVGVALYMLCLLGVAGIADAIINTPSVTAPRQGVSVVAVHGVD